MGKNNEFPIGPLNDAFNGALKVYKKLIERIYVLDAGFKRISRNNYENIYFCQCKKRVTLQLHIHCGCLALVIPGSDKEFPECDLRDDVGVKEMSGYKGVNKFWLDAKRKNYWPPKRAKTFIVQAEQIHNSKVWGQIDGLLKFAKDNCIQYD